MMVAGYVFTIPANSEISLSFENVLADNDVLSDLFTLSIPTYKCSRGLS